MEAPELKLCLLKASNQLSMNSWVSLSSLAALFDVKVFKMAAFTHFYACNYFGLISSTPKSSLSPIRNLKLRGALQGLLTSPNGFNRSRVSGVCALVAVLCEIATAGAEREGLICFILKYKLGREFWDSQISLFHTSSVLFSKMSSFHWESAGSSSNSAHCQTVNMLRDLGLISFRQRKTLGLSLLVPGQIFFVVRYYLSDDYFFFVFQSKKWLYFVFGYRVCSRVSPEATSVFRLWMRAGFQEQPCTWRKGTPFWIA